MSMESLNAGVENLSLYPPSAGQHAQFSNRLQTNLQQHVSISAKRFETHDEHINWLVFEVAQIKGEFSEYRDYSSKKIAELGTERDEANAQISELSAKVVQLIEERDGYRHDWLQIKCELKAIRNWMGFEQVCI